MRKGKCPKLGQTELCPGWLATRRRRFSAEAGSKTARAERESRTAANERHEPPPPPSPLQTRRRGRATPGRPRRRGRHGAFERGRGRNRTTRTANERPSGTRRGGGRRSPSRRHAHSPRPPPGAAQGEAAAPYLFVVHRECALARPCSWLLSWWLPSSERDNQKRRLSPPLASVAFVVRVPVASVNIGNVLDASQGYILGRPVGSRVISVHG